jgi:hypothetical protein
MTDQIAYETLPIGQPGTWVIDQRRRLAVEMDKLQAENRHLKQMLVIAWRFMQDESAEDLNRHKSKAGYAETLARELERLGVPVDCNAVTLERKA